MGLIKDIQSDLDSAAVRIVGEYRARLHAAAVKLCGDAGEADDLVMRTFDAAFRETSSYDETKGELYPWLVGVLHRIHARSNRRLVDRGTVPVDPAVLQDLAGTTEDSINKVLEDSDHEALRAALERLDPEYKRVLVMHYFGELPVKQIATVLNAPVGTILWRLSIARKILARDLGEKLGKKPLAVLLAALLGIGSLFGAWQAGLLEPLFSDRGEAESFPLQEETFQSGEADQSKEATKSGESNQRGEAYPPSEASCEAGAMRGESFPLHGGPVSTQLQSQSETSLTQEKSQSETKKEQTMNLKTVKTLAATAVVAASAAVADATTITIKNFDEDLATVYVNGEPTTNGQVVVVSGDSVTIELANFQNDYYFRFAPETQDDKQLAFASWEGVPEGCETQNPVTFEISDDLTITPNVNVKGYKWSSADGTTAENQYFQWALAGRNDEDRTFDLGKCIKNTAGTTTPSLPLDCVQRVEYNGKNYTITAITARACADNSYIDRIVLPHRFSEFGASFAGIEVGGTFKLIELVGLADASVSSIGGNAFYSGAVAFNGFVGNYVPTNVVTLGGAAYRQGTARMKGELCLKSIQTLGGSAFMGCTGLTAARIISPNLTTIGGYAFGGCSSLADVTLDASHLTSVGSDSFPSAVKRFEFIGSAPTLAIVGNIVEAQLASDGEHSATMQIDPADASWWALIVSPTANEIAAGIPEGCIGVFANASGARKAWVIADGDAAGQVLVETDMTKQGNVGCTIHSGLGVGEPLVLTAPEGMTMCEFQHLENGVWKTFDTKSGSSVTYTHEGQLTRALWGVDGARLTVTAKGYSGRVSIEVKSGGVVSGDDIYSKGSVVWITAIGSDVRPRSVLDTWTGDVPAGQEKNTVLKLTLTESTTVTATFRPLEWVYNPSTKKITDGEYTSTPLVGDIVDYGMTFKDFTAADYTFWLDFSLPVYNPNCPDQDHWITSVTAERNVTWTRVRFGEHITSLPNAMFLASLALRDVEGFGKTKITNLPGLFFYNYDNLPLRSRTYEAEDFVPLTLRTVGSYAFSDGPNLVGSLRLNVANISALGGLRFSNVTNIEFLAEDVTSVPSLGKAEAGKRVVFASTNLTSAVENALHVCVKDLVFLAHAPAVAALDNMLGRMGSKGTVIHASRYAPGWKELRAKGYRSMEEWKTCPDGCWGIYQTKDGQKRFYLVQQDSKYDRCNGLMLILK